jgi:2-oxo-4-hydroxy-4-carboxy-5-ureidoimidazoline decarboxylase
MAEPHELLNAMSEAEAAGALIRCCAARRWVDAMLALRPFGSTEQLYQSAERCWRSLERADYLEAFAHHPAIGEDIAKLRDRWSSQEQAGVAAASEATLRALRDGNVRYRDKFGYVFLVCATGKSADEMRALLEARLPHEPEHELQVAAAEHEKITRLRLAKLAAP